MTDEKTTNRVYAKIGQVVKKQLYVQKTGYNAFHKYKYATEADILTSLRTAFTEVGLIYTMSVVSAVQTGEFTNIMTEFRLIDLESGDSLMLMFPGCGQDKGDKGLYKAFTGCQKYFLAKNFMIETGDDPENDTGETKQGTTPAPDNGGEDIPNKVIAHFSKPPATTEKVSPRVEIARNLALLTPNKDEQVKIVERLTAVTDKEGKVIKAGVKSIHRNALTDTQALALLERVKDQVKKQTPLSKPPATTEKVSPRVEIARNLALLTPNKNEQVKIVERLTAVTNKEGKVIKAGVKSIHRNALTDTQALALLERVKDQVKKQTPPAAEKEAE